MSGTKNSVGETTYTGVKLPSNKSVSKNITYGFELSDEDGNAPIVKSGESRIVRYLFTEVLRVGNGPIPSKDSLQSFCAISVQDGKGREYAEFVAIEALDISQFALDNDETKLILAKTPARRFDY